MTDNEADVKTFDTFSAHEGNQIFYTRWPKILQKTTLSVAAKYTYLVLCGHLSAKNPNKAWPAIDTLADECGLSASTVKRAIAELIQSCLLTKKNVKCHTGQRNEYYLVTMFDSAFVEIVEAITPITPVQKEPVSNGTSSKRTSAPVQIEPVHQFKLNRESDQRNSDQQEQDQKKKNHPPNFDPQPTPLKPSRKPKSESPSPSAPVPSPSNPSEDFLNLKGIENPEASISLAKDWLEWAKSKSPWSTGFTLHNFAEAIITIQRQGKFNHEPVRHLFEWVKRSDFWSKNAISPCGLTKRKGNGLKKWETIMHQMQADKEYRTTLVREKLKTKTFERLF